MKRKAASPSGKSARGSSRSTAAKPKTLTTGERIAARSSVNNKSRTTGATIAYTAAFDEVLHLIEAARQRAFQAANTELIDLYWNVGAYISRKLAAAEWGDGVVDQLARYIAGKQPGIRGFTRANLFRMRQFYEIYRGEPIVAPVVRQLSWTNNLIVFSRCKIPEEREFYLRLSVRERWGKRDLERQIKARLFERAVLHPPKISAVLRELHPDAESHFKDSYLFDFLLLPDSHSEGELQSSLITNLRRFLLELGRDFTFVGEQYPIQVGRKDFHLDLLFYHRELRCLIAIELKTDEFHPSHLGQLNFYLEALDRDVKKPHENPSIGVLLCATKDSEVVEYALSRSLSPTLVAEYKTKLPDRALLQRKLHEFYEQLALPEPPAKARAKR